MVARAGGCYGTVFQGARKVTQGDPLSHTIFNVVVDAVVRHWMTVVIAGTEERSKCGQEGRHQTALFYAYYDMVALSDPYWSLFDRVVLWNNVGKIFSMVCRPFQAAGDQ